MHPLVTLTTDFEEREPYVASTKGVLLSRCPGAQIVDLTHAIPRGNLMEAGLFTAGSVPHFPKETVHIVAVGSAPPPIAIRIADQFLVTSDSGIVTLLAERFPIEEARAISHPDLIPTGGGQIYYARDVFARAAAVLASGGPMEDLGERVERPVLVEMSRPQKDGARALVGRTIHVNRFGSLLTNIHRSTLEGRSVKRITAGDFPVGPLSASYGDVASGSPLALFGSEEYLEIAYNGDRATDRLRMGPGIRVTVEFERA